MYIFVYATNIGQVRNTLFPCVTHHYYSHILSLTHSHTYTAVRGVCFLRLSPPTSDLARRGGGGALSWTGSLLSTPLAATSGLARRRQRRGARLDRE